MATQAAVNPDLPGSWLIPGIYFKLNLSGSGAGLNTVSKRLLLWGYRLSSGSQPPDSPVQITQQADVNTYFGQGSDIARLYAASISQVGGGVCDVYCMGINEPSSGTAATHLITFAGPATAAGSVDVWICGYKTSVGVANGDSASTVGTNVAAAIYLLKDIPVTASGTSTVTLTYRHKGVIGNDLPVIVNINNATGITASPGTIAFSGTASGAGTTSISIGGTTISATISNSDSASVIASALNTAINAGAYPVTASVSSSTVTLFYAPDRAVHRITGSITAAITTTITPAVGTAGAGTPTLTTALTNAAALTAFPFWCSAFNDTSSLGTLSTHIETYADGLNQKGQRLFYCSTEALATAGAIPVGTTPLLTATPRYRALWEVDSPQQAYELAGRAAAEATITDYPPRNYDGVALKTRGTVPLLHPHKVVRSSPSDQNAALYSYFMTPIVVDESTGTLRILRGRTTSNASDQRLWDWGCIDTLDYYRYDLNAFLYDRFKQKSVKLTGTPKTTNTITPQSIIDAVYERAKTWDDNDLFDDIDSLKNSIVVNADPTVSGRFDIAVPGRPPVPFHQGAGNINLT